MILVDVCGGSMIWYAPKQRYGMPRVKILVCSGVTKFYIALAVSHDPDPAPRLAG
jgi:hypothetical protein